MTLDQHIQDHPRANKTDAGNGSKAICSVSNVSRSPSPDPKRSAKERSRPASINPTSPANPMNAYLVAVMITVSGALVAEDRGTVSPSPGATIIARLEQIVSLRQKAAHQHALRVSANRKAYDFSYDLELASAELELARERHADADSIKALNQIVVIRRKALDFEKSLLSSDRGSAKSFTDASVALLHAEIDMEREVQKQKAGKK